MTNDAPFVAGRGPRAIKPARSLLGRAICDPGDFFEETRGCAGECISLRHDAFVLKCVSAMTAEPLYLLAQTRAYARVDRGLTAFAADRRSAPRCVTRM
jgi:hypothetical protein